MKKFFLMMTLMVMGAVMVACGHDDEEEVLPDVQQDSVAEQESLFAKIWKDYPLIVATYDRASETFHLHSRHDVVRYGNEAYLNVYFKLNERVAVNKWDGTYRMKWINCVIYDENNEVMTRVGADSNRENGIEGAWVKLFPTGNVTEYGTKEYLIVFHADVLTGAFHSVVRNMDFSITQYVWEHVMLTY